MENCTFPRVSVVTPSFNSVQFIERTIQSVQRQDYPNIDHIIIDGGSTDGTLDILKRYPHLRWISEPDRGQSDALNKGFRLAEGEIIGWLNADDTYNPGAVSEAVTYLTRHLATAMVYSNCNVIDEHDYVTYHWVAPSFDLARELYAHSLPQQTAFFRREALHDVGLVDPDLHYIMDWDLFLRLGHRYIIGYVDATWANFRICAGTKTTTQPRRFWEEALSMFERFFALPDLPPQVQAIKGRAYARAHWMLGIMDYARLDAVPTGAEHCAKALTLYPLLQEDQAFVCRQITDWAIRYVAAESREKYLQTIMTTLPISEQKRIRALHYVSAHFYATLILMAGKMPEIPVPNKRLLLNWFLKCIRYNPGWLAHRGVFSTTLRGVLGIAKGSTQPLTQVENISHAQD